MALSPPMRRALENWIVTRLKNRCPVCGEGGPGQFNNDGTFALPLLQGASGPDFTKILPVVPLACNNCGNVIFISALALGMEKKDAEQYP